MKNVAITGSFSSGKSFVLGCARDLGYRTFSCDDFVKKAYEDKNLQNYIVQEIKELKFFDKKKLLQIIYQYPESKQKLESIIHPKVRLGIEDFEKSNMNEELIFTEVPLLFETGSEKIFFCSICVFCLEELRLERAKKRKGYSLSLFHKISKVQLSQEQKKIRANFVIDSGLPSGEIEQKLKNVIKQII